MIDADQYLDANSPDSLISANISNVEASNTASVLIGEQLASYDTAVTFDIQDEITNIIGSLLQLGEDNPVKFKLVDVRDIIVTDTATI